ncbi:MAG: ABC transporter permease [Chloroflexi bacterium]|nr:ABC transporter permease [Chloroflexota bacterium]
MARTLPQQAIDDSAAQEVEAPAASRSGELLRRVLANPSAVIGLALLLLMVGLAVFAPLIAHYGPNTIDVSSFNQEPSGAHWFGTDYLGRDVWSRCLYGGRISLPAGLQVVALGFALGTPLGLVAGYVGGFVDDLIMRLMDVLFSFPGFLLAIGVVAILGPGLESAVIAVGIAIAPSFARVARGSTLSARENDYVLAARLLGTPHRRIIFRHILGNVIGPLIVVATLSLGGAILVTAGLSYLGLGTQLPTSDWGTMLSGGYSHMFEAWSEVAFPGLAIVISVLGVNLLGDGLSDAFNPRL